MKASLIDISTRTARRRRFLLPTSGQFLPRPLLSPTPIRTVGQLAPHISSLGSSQFLAVDLETRGLLPHLPIRKLNQGDPSDPDSIELIGIGLAGDSGAIYFDWKDGEAKAKELILALLRSHPQLVAHNIPFDGTWLYRLLGGHASWKYDTLSLIRYLASEGYVGDSAKLKNAMIEYLGWNDTNEKRRDDWLISQGCCLRDGAPDPGQMWRCPADILGEYCMLDAEATYLLLTRVLLPTLAKFPQAHTFFREEVIPHIQIHMEQYFHGLDIDLEGFSSRRAYLESTLSQLDGSFLQTYAKEIAPIEALRREKDLGAEPTKYKKCKIKDPGEKRLTKSGQISKQWEKQFVRYSSHNCELECVSKIWLGWKEREKISQNTPHFSLASGDQLRELLYGRMGFAPAVFTKTSIKKVFPTGRLPERTLTKEEIAKLTPAVNNIALRGLGPIGADLNNISELRKELTAFVYPYPQFAKLDGKIHPLFSIPGTVTGRISAREPNITQCPKTKSIMSLFKAPEGRIFIDADFAALEPRVAAEFSRDPNMLFLYNKEGKPNDIYLFVGSQVPGAMGNKIRDAGYNPYSPTKEGISAAKKLCKAERNTAKTICLAAVYGAGVKRLHRTFIEQNISISFIEVEEIYNAYWTIFAGVRDFAAHLTHRWEVNGYFLKNGMGRPLAIEPEFRQKDILNSFIQSTGVDILVCAGNILAQNLREAKLHWRPAIWNWHDAITITVPVEEKEAALSIFHKTEKELNEQLKSKLFLPRSRYGSAGPVTYFSWEPVAGKTLADVKQPED